MFKRHVKSKKFLISRLIFLIVLVAANTFAWFIYATKVDSSVSIHVRAWNVVFEANNNQVTNVLNINVDSIYPGMEDYTYEVNAYNHSEVSADMTYEILEARILNNTYITTEGRVYRGENALPTDPTSSELEEQLADDYPFTIYIDVTDDHLVSTTGAETFSLNVEWPYESNQDDVDTLWGVNAYNYQSSNPNSPSISLVVKIIITQSSS